ncbi:hypothetical protein HK24_07020 [Gluconobacter sp. DsW_058]|nr:hypothetical protein HK24_07020 [Gluconobacter sp. DsW_058]
MKEIYSIGESNDCQSQTGKQKTNISDHAWTEKSPSLFATKKHGQKKEKAGSEILISLILAPRGISL